MDRFPSDESFLSEDISSLSERIVLETLVIERVGENKHMNSSIQYSLNFPSEFQGTDIIASRKIYMVMPKNEQCIILLITGELGVSSTLAGRRSKDDDSDGSQLCFSPTITYASAQPFAPAVL